MLSRIVKLRRNNIAAVRSYRESLTFVSGAARRAVHEPAPRLVNIFIPSPLPAGETERTRIPSPPPDQHGNFNRIAVLFFLCYDKRRDEAEGTAALPDDAW